jgi:hypothetical protein
LDAVVILVGVTADRRKRACVETYFRRTMPGTVLCPWLPQRLGFGICAMFLRRRLNQLMQSGQFRAIHFVNYISGGYLFRRVAVRCTGLPVGRVVYVRSPVQEKVPAVLAARLTPPGLLLLGGATMLSLARPAPLQALPWPSNQGQGLIVEDRISALARDLGLSRDSTSPRDWDHDVLLPHATDVLHVPVSHDEVYESTEVLSAIAHFLTHGSFDHVPRQ